MNVRCSTYNAQRSILALVVVSLLVLSLRSEAQEAWRKDAQKIGLTAEDIKSLATNKVLLTREVYRQIFEPYLGPQTPVFVTSDSLLNAFHVLFEDGVTRIEMSNAVHLRAILTGMWTSLQEIDRDAVGDKELIAAAKQRVQIILGVGLRLAGDESSKIEGEVRRLVDDEVKRVIDATVLEKPSWIGPPDPGFLALDYTRYKPRGFYAGKESLQRYFRASSWLQSIPLRVDKDTELLAACLLAKAADTVDWKIRGSRQDVFGFYREFLGAGDDWDLSHWKLMMGGRVDTGRLPEIRKGLHEDADEHGHRVRINDQVRYEPDDANAVSELQCRVMSAARLPDAVLFQETTDSRRFPNRNLPHSLEVCAALGSEAARSLLTKERDANLMKVIEKNRAEFTGNSIYQEYLRCLAALTEAPPEDAPAFMKQESWQLKSIQSVLGGWSQIRHTWALQAKQNVTYMCAVMGKTVGFVEPNPEFYSRLALLTEKIEQVLEQREVFSGNMLSLAEELRAIRTAVHESNAIFSRGVHRYPDVDPSDKESRVERARLLVSAWDAKIPMLDVWVDVPENPKPSADALAKIKEDVEQRIEELAVQLERGQWPEDEKLTKALLKIQSQIDVGLDFARLWQRLARLCRRLEALSNKQLRPVAFNKEEQQFLLHYGEELGGIMLYGGTTYITHPRDDTPQVVDVASNPNTGKFLEVGIGRPRALYVLYPWKGEEKLCRGAVLPYYELVNPTRLTDSEWKALLDSEKCPPQPEWVKPICGVTENRKGK